MVQGIYEFHISSFFAGIFLRGACLNHMLHATLVLKNILMLDLVQEDVIQRSSDLI